VTPKWPLLSLEQLETKGLVELGRGNVISRKDIAANPGSFPIYSSAKDNEGKFGEYGAHMFDEEMITWSIDGGGRLFYRQKHKFSVTNVGGTLRVKDKSKIDTRYLFFALTDLHAKHSFDWVAKAHPSVVRKVYSRIPLPPLDEQKRIVAKLDKALGDLDQVVTKTSKTFADANDLWEASLTLMFEGSLRGDRKDVFSLKDACNNPKSDIVDGPFGSNLKRSDFIESGIPVLKIQNIKTSGINLKKMDYVNESKYSELKRHSFSRGDVILTKLGDPLGISAVVEEVESGLIVADLVRIRLSEKVDARFICYQLNSGPVRDALNKQQKGTTRPRVTLQMVRDLPVFCPPLDEQKRIVAKLDSLKAEIEKIKSLKQQTLSESTHLRSSILSAAFAGDF
jgi:restriction endonuclease S subunit